MTYRVWGEETNFKEYFEAYLLGSAYWRKIGRKLSERAAGASERLFEISYPSPKQSRKTC